MAIKKKTLIFIKGAPNQAQRKWANDNNAIFYDSRYSKNEISPQASGYIGLAPSCYTKSKELKEVEAPAGLFSKK